MRVHLDLNDKSTRVILRCAYFPGISEMCKAVSGASWSKVNKQWSYPLSMQTLRRLREVFGQNLAPTERLLAWAREERARERATAVLGAANDAELMATPQIAPRAAEAMATRTYQRSGARYINAAAGQCVIADEPGLGKTITSLSGIMESGLWEGDHLVICPKTSVFSTWVSQISRWTGVEAFGMPDGLAKRKAVIKQFFESDSPVRIMVVNKEMLRRHRQRFCKKCEMWEPKKSSSWPIEHHMEEHEAKTSIFAPQLKVNLWPEIVEHGWTSVIVDEAHSMLASYKPSNVSQMMEGMLDLKAKSKIALTGTPLRGNELNLWGYLDWLGVKTGGYWSFASQYFEIQSGFFGKTIGGLREDAREEFETFLNRYFLRRTRAEVRPDLPMGQRNDILVKMSDKHKKQYDEFEKMGEVALSEGTVSGKGVLSELTRLRQMAFGTWSMGNKMRPDGESPKIEWLMESFLAPRGINGKRATEFLPESGSGYKYVVASQFNEILDAVGSAMQKAGIEFSRIDGSVSGKKRLAVIEDFNSIGADPLSDKRVMLLNSKAGGESIDLDAWCDEMVILDETFIADDQVQLEGRINNRSGRIAPRTWWYVRTEDTIEQNIAESNYAQHNLQHAILDGRRGIDIALHLIRGES